MPLRQDCRYRIAILLEVYLYFHRLRNEFVIKYRYEALPGPRGLPATSDNLGCECHFFPYKCSEVPHAKEKFSFQVKLFER
jgi:hypothetical protein